MKLTEIIPGAAEIGHEALIVILGAVAAAAIIGQPPPAVRETGSSASGTARRAAAADPRSTRQARGVSLVETKTFRASPRRGALSRLESQVQ